MKNKIFILLIAFALILSVNSAFAIDEVDDNLSVDNDVDVVEEVDAEIQSQDILTSDENNEELSAPSEAEVLGDEPVFVKPGQVTNRYYDGVIYTATFYDDSGNPLKDASVFCGLDSAEFGRNAFTDANGVAKFPFLVKNGNHKLYLMSQYNTENPVIDNIKVFNVLTGGKNIKMYYDDGSTYKLRVFDNNGNPVKAGEKVTFYVNNQKYTKKTDKNGYASLKITSKPDSYTIGAKYKDFVVSNALIVKNPLKVKTGSLSTHKAKVKITVKFLGKNKKNKKIKIKFNKKNYVAKTNKKGVAIFKLKNPKKSGAYKVIVSYKKIKDTYVLTKY